MKKEQIKRFLTALLAAVFLIGCLPGVVFADSYYAENELLELPVAEESPAVQPEEPQPVGEPQEEEEPQSALSSEIADGLYLIESALSPELVLEIEGDSLENKGNAALARKTGDFRQAFYVERCGEDVYTVRNYYSGLVLDVAGGLSANGTNIQQYKANGSAAQQWKLTPNEDGTLTFACAKNGKAMDVAGGRAAAGTNVRIYTANGTAAQSWRLTEVCGVTGVFEGLSDSDLGNGYYRIVSAKNSGMCLGIADGSRELTANAALYPREKDTGLIFKVTNLGGGLAQITAPRSGCHVTGV